MIKTTKETHKQDETFKSKVTFDSYDNVYANVNGEMKSLPDYIASKGSAPSNMVTTDTEQHITGHKYFTKLSISNESGTDNFDITTDIDSDTLTNKVYFTREEDSGYYRNEYCFKGGNSTASSVSLIVGDNLATILKVYPSAGEPYSFAFPSNGGTLATTSTLNALIESALTLKSNQTYTCEVGKPSRYRPNHIIIRLINDNNVYTASFDVTKGYDASGYRTNERVAFLMPYGTTSDDVATCFAYYDKDDYDGHLNIDLDNCQLSSGYSLQVFYCQYN